MTTFVAKISVPKIEAIDSNAWYIIEYTGEDFNFVRLDSILAKEQLSLGGNGIRREPLLALDKTP